MRNLSKLEIIQELREWAVTGLDWPRWRDLSDSSFDVIVDRERSSNSFYSESYIPQYSNPAHIRFFALLIAEELETDKT
jgi:hypothetical protein